MLSDKNKDVCDNKDPRDVSNNGFNRFDPKYVSIGPKGPRGALSVQPNKCATLRHGGRYGGSLTGGIRGASPSPHLKNVSQPVITPQPHIQLQQHHLQKINNQEHEQQLQEQEYQRQQQQENYEYAMQQNYQQQQQQLQQSHQASQSYNPHYPASTLPYKKPGSGFTETSSILKKHRDEISMEARTSVYTIETQQQATQTNNSSSKPISILNQPLPEIPQPQECYSKSIKNEKVLSASNLNNYRSLQRPSKQSSSQKDMGKPVIPPKVLPPSLPPKNRHKDEHQFSSISRQRPPQPLPSSKSSGYNSQTNHYPSSKSYEREERDRDRERTRERDRDERSSKSNRSYGFGEQSRISKQQSTFQTLPRNHHHHHPDSFNTSSGKSSSSRKSNDSIDKRSQQHSYSSKSLHRAHRGERESGHHHSNEMYSMTEL